MSDRTIIYEIDKILPKKVVIKLSDELTISEDIDSEVDHAAPEYGFFAVMSEKAETRYQRMKLAYELWEGETIQRKNRALVEADDKRMTGPQAEAYLRSQPKYKALKLKLLEIGEQRRILKVIASAFEKKVELVRTKAANRRGER